MNLNELRAINQAQIKTLMAQDPHAADLLRAQIVEKILADDACFSTLSDDEGCDVLVALGIKPELAPTLLPSLKANRSDR